MEPALALIAAAGRGTRMRGEGNKLFLPIGSHPLLAHTLAPFERAPFISEVLIVAHPDDHGTIRRDVLDRYGFRKSARLVAGGEERQDSVAAGLAAWTAEDGERLVVVHDGARPFLSLPLLERVVRRAAEVGAAIAAVEPVETVKMRAEGDRVGRTVDRSRLLLAQTPQAFRLGLLRRAHAEAGRQGLRVTDDAALVEALGAPVAWVTGERENLKVTTPVDRLVAEAIFRAGRLPLLLPAEGAGR